MQYLRVANSEHPAAATARPAVFDGFLPLAPRMKSLVVGHAASLVMLVALGARYADRQSGELSPFVFAFMCLLLSQIVLLAFWVGIGSRDNYQGAAVAAVGCGFLPTACILPVALFDNTRPDDVIAVGFASIVLSGGIVGALALAIRVFWIKLLRHRLQLAAGDLADRAQWSLKNLFVMTFVAASVLGLARVGGATFVLVVSLIPLASCAAIWTALSLGSPIARMAYALVLAGLCGLTLSVSVGGDAHDIAWVSAGAVLAESIVLGSLLVVRSYGYRLVRTQPPDVTVATNDVM